MVQLALRTTIRRGGVGEVVTNSSEQDKDKRYRSALINPLETPPSLDALFPREIIKKGNK